MEVVIQGRWGEESERVRETHTEREKPGSPIL